MISVGAWVVVFSCLWSKCYLVVFLVPPSLYYILSLCELNSSGARGDCSVPRLGSSFPSPSLLPLSLEAASHVGSCVPGSLSVLGRPGPWLLGFGGSCGVVGRPRSSLENISLVSENYSLSSNSSHLFISICRSFICDFVRFGKK